MSGFKNTTKTVSGHHHWGGGSIGGGTGGTINRLAQGGSTTPGDRRDGHARGGAIDKIDASPGHAEVYPVEGDRMHGNALTQRKESPTQELEEHGGKSPLISKFKAGGPARHFHVHHHHHATGGKITTSTKSYRGHEKKAEAFAEGGHVIDSTEVPAGGPDYKRGGKTRPVRKNAGGAMYAPGGPVARPMMGNPQMGGAPLGGALGQLAARPRGLPMRGAPPLRHAMPMPGPRPMLGGAPAATAATAGGGGLQLHPSMPQAQMSAQPVYRGPLTGSAAMARGGPVGARKVAKQEVAKHERKAPPRGHGVR